jgi:5'-3' exonuclease
MESSRVIFMGILVWVFDGKPPDLKKAELMRRKKLKEDAKDSV